MGEGVLGEFLGKRRDNSICVKKAKAGAEY